jgi:regulator of sirC expression with transglutaminase-like and TPR domain
MNTSKRLSAEEELNELRSLLAAQSARESQMKQLIESLENRVQAVPVSDDPGDVARSAILRALSVANAGKPGFLSHAQIESECKLTKSASHFHVNELEKAAKVWIRKTHDAKSGRPHFLVYHPAAVRP